ncbi:hypothetical protein T10_13068 [Trichinella papuae]|uniref:Uncharacterized protein n=1 Tax=Trichinella papuae TaxID=268474 RepID=A0A0V1MIZ6_9BILA|nr:hypothetical protein T10_13068 [Trichinella papuae]
MTAVGEEREWRVERSLIRMLLVVKGGLKLGNGLEFNSTTHSNSYNSVALLLFSAGPACRLVTDDRL